MIRSSLNALHQFWADLHSFVRFLAIALLLALFAFFGVKPGYRAVKDWKTSHNLSRARAAVNESRMVDARDLSLSVLLTGDPYIEAYRILEKSTASLRDPRHGAIARALMFHPESSEEDRLTGFRSIASDMPLGLVGQAWVSIPPETQRDPRFAKPFGERLIVEERLDEAATVLLSVSEEIRDGALNRSLVQVLIASGKQQDFEQAQRLIADGLSNPSAELAAWLDLIEQLPADILQRDLLEPIRERLEDPNFGDPVRGELILARVEYATWITSRPEVLSTAVTKWKDSDPVALARFLKNLGLHSLLLEACPPELVDGHPSLFPLVLEALEKTGGWNRVIALLDAHDGLIPRAEALAHRAITIAKTNDSGGKAVAWLAAIDEAKSSDSPTTTLLKLHLIAANAGMPDQSEQALVEAIRVGRGPLPLYEDLRPLMISLQDKGREEILVEICAIYLQFELGNPVLLAQYAYLACLNGLIDPATALRALRPVAKAYPAVTSIQCLLAAIYLCDSQNDMAMETLRPLNLDPANLAPTYRATLLTTLVVNRRLSKDDPLVTTFPWTSLLSSERRKFGDLIRTADL